MDWITPQDLVTIAFLVFLEGVLSIDNALVLAMLARQLPEKQQKRALTYGLIGAIIFRLLALAIVTQLMEWNWVKFVGGGYLLFLAIKHFTRGEDHASKRKIYATFWKTVILIELTDIAFALDSILAAVALTNKFWIVFTGGMLGTIFMRFAASGFIHLLKKFPDLETTAYLLVALIGTKVILEGLRLPGLDFHHTTSPAFWIFWVLMFICIIAGFLRRKRQ